jgi:hypothetical protein
METLLGWIEFGVGVGIGRGSRGMGDGGLVKAPPG